MRKETIQVELIYPSAGKVFRQQFKSGDEEVHNHFFYYPLMIYPTDDKEGILKEVEEVDEKEWAISDEMRRIVKESDRELLRGIRHCVATDDMN